MPTQDRDAALVELIAEQMRNARFSGTLPPYSSIPEKRKAYWSGHAREIIETVREYDMDASAPWPLPQEMP